MKLTLNLDPELVEKVSEIAADRQITINDLFNQELAKIIREDEAAAEERKREAIEALKRSFDESSFPVGKRTWTRADLHERR
ncbi:MAG TPA: hypothetical protein VN736_09850 [Candidatus Limnocylindrales bacterium]|nr:hypothetical protein [Candidatus Limnocylindrales bacterium]